MNATSPNLGMPLVRLVVVWAFLTVAALFGPCHPPVGPAPALASEITP